VRRRAIRTLVLSAGTHLVAALAGAFVYSEHREIAGAAIAGLPPEKQGELARLWALARTGHEDRLCAEPWAGEQGLKPSCIDLAHWSAIAGDHSCSPLDLLHEVLKGKDTLPTAVVAARERASPQSATVDAQRRNASSRSQVAMARIDPSFATRAGANNSHFLLPRKSQDFATYVERALDASSEPNSMATYVLFHEAALVLAGETPPGQTGPEAEARARLLLALEAFAEHFLEDMFAAGHVAGSWGNVAERKGTHDFYNRSGLEVRTWAGQEPILFGDAFLNSEGLSLAAAAVRRSLSQVLEAATPGLVVRSDAAGVPVPEAALSGSYDVCAAKTAPDWDPPAALHPYVEAVAQEMPIPFRVAGPGSLPRYHAEIGPYLALVAGGTLAGGSQSFDDLDTGGQLIDALFLGFRFGIGLEELLTTSGDGLIFLEGGVAISSKEATDCPECPHGRTSVIPRVPARTGLTARLRSPFWLVPGDMVVVGPILRLFSPDAFTKMAAAAASGGLLPWQRKIATPMGHFQLMVGREVGATFFGFTGGADELVTFVGDQAVIVGLRSVLVEFPILEYEPFRTYGAKQTLDLRFQFGFGFDKPVQAKVIEPPGFPAPSLNTRYFGYIRLVFEGRRYL